MKAPILLAAFACACAFAHADIARMPTAGAASRQLLAVANETTLIPVIVRWAQTDGLVPVLDGRRVTTRSLWDQSFDDLPLTPEARAATGATAEEAIEAALKSYAAYRTDIDVSATFKAPHFVVITTRKRAPVGAQTPLEAPVTRTAQPQPQPRPAPATFQVPPPPLPLAATTAGVVPAPTWDHAARKSAGVMAGTWLVGDGPSLRAVVEAWARQSGFQVEWTSRHDYRVSDAIRSTRFTGTFREALLRLAIAFGQLESPLGMTFVNKAGAPTLRVFDA